jgi:hypothetical protein
MQKKCKIHTTRIKYIQLDKLILRKQAEIQLKPLKFDLMFSRWKQPRKATNKINQTFPSPKNSIIFLFYEDLRSYLFCIIPTISNHFVSSFAIC